MSRARDVAFATTSIMVGCFLNVVSLELVVRRDPGAGNLITLAQFLFIAGDGLRRHLRWRSGGGAGASWCPLTLAPRSLPMLLYLKMTGLFFVASVANNMALGFQISVPLQTIFRSCGLVATLLLGWGFFGHRYSRAQVLGCALVTAGIMAATLADANLRTSRVRTSVTTSSAAPGAVTPCCDSDAIAAAVDVATGIAASATASLEATGTAAATAAATATVATAAATSDLAAAVAEALLSTRWWVGIAMLVASLFATALLGQLQQKAFAVHGKSPEECVFYTHALSLPAFALALPDIGHHVSLWATLAPIEVALPGTGLSFSVSIYTLLVVNVLTQYVCIRGVFWLTSCAGTVTCTLVLTVRKFVSLAFSIFYFQNPFTPTHWFGTVAVFVGAAIYSLAPSAKVAPVATTSAIAETKKEQ